MGGRSGSGVAVTLVVAMACNAGAGDRGLGSAADTSATADPADPPDAESTGDEPEPPDTDGDAATSEPGDESSDTGDAPELPPFACDVQPAASPVLDGLVLFDPAQPHIGDTLSVIVRAQNGLVDADAPHMDLEVATGTGTNVMPPLMRAGGQVLYYYAIPQVTEGEVCVRGIIDGATEVTAKIAVTPRPPGPPIDGGIFKVVQNHQWTCAEQPGFGNELHVDAREADGTPIPDLAIAIDPADSTDLDTIHNDGPIPRTITTDSEGHATLYNYWPTSDNGLLVLQVSVANAASDIATEITTGWWETDPAGCHYCDEPTVNVWGHWSYTIELVRDPTATEVCVVENDHAGQAACGPPGHVLHHPDVRSCWAP